MNRLFAKPRRNQRGASLILVMGAMVSLLGITAFTVDFGRAYVVKGELQNAADSAALAGIGSIGNFYDQDWAAACDAAETYAAKNKVLKTAVADGDLSVLVGVWSEDAAFELVSDCADLPIASFSLASDELPAVRVTVDRSEASASGVIPTVFAPLMGVDFFELDATATGVIATSTSGKGMPFAFSNCLKNALLNADGSPKTNSPLTFRVYGSSSAGQPNDVACKDIGGNVFQGFAQWVSFCTESGCNGNKSVQDILSDPEVAVPVEPGDTTDILGGSVTNLYGKVTGDVVLVPLLSETLLPTGQKNVTIENLIALELGNINKGKPVLNNGKEGGQSNFIEFTIADPVKFVDGLPDLDGPRTAGVMTKSILVN